MLIMNIYTEENPNPDTGETSGVECWDSSDQGWETHYG